MEHVCLDLEGVLIPEIWSEVAKYTGEEQFKLTTQDLKDYSELMDMRIDLVKSIGLSFLEIQSLVDKKTFFGKVFKPNLLLSSNKVLFKIADEIWFLSGDKSTDYNYYTKRIILMKVYALTFSFFIFDNSKNLERTRNFLDKEIDIVLKFGNFANKIKNKIRF